MKIRDHAREIAAELNCVLGTPSDSKISNAPPAASFLAAAADRLLTLVGCGDFMAFFNSRFETEIVR
ncbi:MAG: hypothetical protein ABSG88_16825 [Bradyrhizobium sp.]